MALSLWLVETGRAPWVWLVAFLWLCLAAFFRQPFRAVPRTGEDTLLSPADGRISAVEAVHHPTMARNDRDTIPSVASAATANAIVIRIFLSVLNVHTNRAPCAMTVTDIVHRPGRYLDARSPESAKENEMVDITLVRPDGVRIGIRQIAGAIARRIICQLQPGDQLVRGETWGLIKFGSTTELVLPAHADCEVLVKEGDVVRSGATPLVRLRPRSETRRDGSVPALDPAP
ncbi:MAG: phosphatidylserine decarboxylase [Planctomycetota bacterium]|nr:phosphatidylserine decarboxylase [Planctomycetota bacterium]